MSEGGGDVNKQNRPRAAKTNDPVLPEAKMEQGRRSSRPEAIPKFDNFPLVSSESCQGLKKT
eukprot:11910611-Prorocentrum_lima.AAC.1